MRARLLVGTCLIALVAALFAFPVLASAAGTTNAQCMECHNSVRPQNFHVGAVNRDTACKKCHVDSFVGTHPYHNSTANCGAICHPGMGASLASAVPSVLTTGGAFATAISQDTSPALLHIIHANPRWETSLIKNGNDCGRCHATSACTACHDDVAAPVASVHANHSSTSTTSAPWVGDVSYGLPTGKVTGAVLRCGAPSCHNTAGVAAAKPGLMENYNSSANPAADFLATTVSYVGTWRTTYGAAYSRGQQSVGIGAGAELSTTFTGQRVYLISDRDQYRGIAEVFLDGVSQGTIDLYNPVTKPQVVVWKSESLSNSAHTIKVRVTGSQNPNARAAYVAVDQFKVYAGVPASIAPNCTDSCHPDKAAGHGYTWPHEATQTAGNFYNGGTGNYRCDSCHSMLFLNEHGRTTSSSYGKSCSNCHTTYAPMAITGTWVATDGCNYSQCHASATPRQPHASITASHTASTETTQQPCRDCHAGDLGAIHNNSITTNAYTTNCNTCHSQTKFPASKSCSAQGCHDASGVRLVDDHAMNATFNTRHTASSMTSSTQSPGPDGAIYTATKDCSACHSAKLTTAHATTSIGAIGCTSGGTGNTGCHFNTSLNTMSVAKTGWATDKCAECHDYGTAKTHDTATTTHVVPAGSCAGSGTSCHNYTDLAALHAVRQSGGTAKYSSCTNNDAGDPTGCHTTLDKRPARWASDTASCGQGTSGCHTDKTTTNHGGKHALNLTGSDYNAATASGCTNSGSGCHGASTSTNIATYHPNSGCTTGPCHTSPSKPTHHEVFVCTDCHDGTYTGAVDTTALVDLAPVGHFAETSHTVSADTSVSSGGSASAKCSNCHNPVVGSQRGLYAQHQGLAASQVVSAAVTPVMACAECHNYSIAISAVVTGKWPTKTCDACHDGTAGKVQPQHNGTTAPVVTATSPQSCGATGAGCHTSYDVHALHKNAAGGCNLSGCHDYTKQGVKPTGKSCGSGGGACHATYTVTSHGTVNGDDAKHTVSVMSTKVDGTTYDTGGGNTCASCHTATLKTAHGTTSLAIPAVSCTTGGTGNVGCHNSTAIPAATTQVKSSWPANTCAACHATSHTTYTLAKHTATLGTAGVADGCANTGCHSTGATTDVRLIHNRVSANRGCTSNGTDSKGWAGSCHALDKAMPSGSLSCGQGGAGATKCHVNHTNSNHVPAHDANDAESVNCTKSGCHEAGPTRSIATTSVISLHATDTIGVTVSGKTNNGCNICHGGNGWTDVHATAKANATGFQCVGCHNGTVVGTHTYTGRDGTSLHYTSNATTHTAAATQSGINYTGGYACTQCHPLDMWAAHTGPTDVAFTTVPGTYADKCRACHESKVDAFTASTWNTKLCTACHTTAASHDMTATAHNATNAAIPTPGPSWTDAVPTGGFSDGFESGDFSNWTTADTPASTPVWNATMSGTTAWTSTIAPTTPALGRAFATNSNTTAGALRTAQTNGQTSSDTIYVRVRGTSGALTDCTMTSAGYNLSAYNAAHLSWYDTLAGYVAGDYVNVQWSADGGTTWTTESALTANEGSNAIGGWIYHEVTLPTAKLGTNCMVRFVYHQVASGQYTFTLDNIMIEGLQIPGWSVQSATVNTGTDAARAAGGDATTRYLTKTGIVMTGSSTTLSYAISWSGLAAGDTVGVETYDGATWTSRKTYTPTASQAWMTDSISGLPNTVTGVRFAFKGSTTSKYLYVDDVSVTPAGPVIGASTAGVSCMNNPNGTECHDVSDVAALHNNTVSKCTACHKNNTTLPVIECQTAGCHAGVNLSEHIQKGVGTPAHHENAGSYATYAVANECAGCHDDSVANEHFVLTANTSKPCTVCHKTNYTVGTYSPAKATVTAQITAKNITCNGCHTTSTATSPHAQRMGTTTTLGSAQFQTNWSGHRVWSTMPGSKTSWTTAVDGATQTLALPTGAWLNSGWTATSMVLCSDCHGSITGSSGPHGAAMTVNIADGYDNSFTDGTLYITSTAGMSNSTNLCAKCHTTALGYNSAHSEGNHQGNLSSGQCTLCHSKTPHAWKRPRLIGYTTDPAPYQSTVVTGITMIPANATNWSKSDCGATGACNTHTQPGTRWP